MSVDGSTIVAVASRDPWEIFAAHHRRGETVTAIVSNVIDDLGLFVDLGNQVFGIVHLSDLSWNTPAEQEIRRYSVGCEVVAIILSIQVDLQRISLSIKQTRPNPIRPTSGR